ncbi:hypothetical protein [Actinomadura harenae]|uniref:Uncharacterized protein n=1 Tax=Actinomadura harenae TaxID=2483351 RepID=A0A3M2LNI5_9ACTN|nr:hypothetical protein [Actinomadura harenae]RMI39007.1 hypothetical protein EBO15_31085 [Actinomadura harenae]
MDKMTQPAEPRPRRLSPNALCDAVALAAALATPRRGRLNAVAAQRGTLMLREGGQTMQARKGQGAGRHRPVDFG